MNTLQSPRRSGDTTALPRCQRSRRASQCVSTGGLEMLNDPSAGTGESGRTVPQGRGILLWDASPHFHWHLLNYTLTLAKSYHHWLIPVPCTCAQECKVWGTPFRRVHDAVGSRIINSPEILRDMLVTADQLSKTRPQHGVEPERSQCNGKAACSLSKPPGEVPAYPSLKT